jgi:hypothetical protein
MLGAGCATPGVDQDSAQVAAADGAAQVTKECRYAKSTGSKMRTRLCYTAEEWAMIDTANAREQDTDAFFRRALENSTTGVDLGDPDSSSIAP